MIVPKCSKCHNRFDTLSDQAFRTISQSQGLDVWNGKVCLKCNLIFCSYCGDISICPVCKMQTQPALGKYIKSFTKPMYLDVEDKQNIETEAETLKEAEDKAITQIPPAFSLLTVNVICDGKDKTVEGSGETESQALEEAKKQLPARSTFKDKFIIRKPETCTLIVQAFNEADAVEEARTEAKATIVVQKVALKEPPRKGFLCLGKKPGIYSIDAIKTALVRITYAEKARVRIKIGRYICMIDPFEVTSKNWADP